MGFMDDKDASRTIRMGLTDRIVVSHDTRELTERRFLMDKSLYKPIRVLGLAGVLLIFALES